MKKLIATALLSFAAGAGTTYLNTSQAESLAYDMDVHSVVADPGDVPGVLTTVTNSDGVILSKHPLSDYTYNPYPNGDVDWNNRLNVLDLNFMIKYVMFGDSLPIRPDF